MQAISRAVLGSGIKVQVRGSGWWRSWGLRKSPALSVKSGWIADDDMRFAYDRSTAAVGLYSKLNRNVTSGRIFELPAIGVPLITYGNEVIESVIGKNYIDLRKADALRRLPALLSDSELMTDISVNARRELMAAGCSWDDRVGEAFAEIDAFIFK